MARLTVGQGQGTLIADDLRLQVRVIDCGSSRGCRFALWDDFGHGPARLLVASGGDQNYIPEFLHASGNHQVQVR